MADSHKPTFELSSDNSTITLTDGSVFADNDHVNIIWTSPDGVEHSLNIHLEAKCIDRTDAECAGDRHVWAQAIGKPSIETGLAADDCVDWIQVGLHNYHYYGDCETDPGTPVEPVEPPPAPVEPPVDLIDPPVEPPVDPVDPPTEPVDPPTEPVDPPVDPTEPPVDPVDPPTDPVDPPVDPGTPDPVDPVDPPVDPGTPVDPGVPTLPDLPGVPTAPVVPDPVQPTATVTDEPFDGVFLSELPLPYGLAQTGPADAGLLLAASMILTLGGLWVRRVARKVKK